MKKFSLYDIAQIINNLSDYQVDVVLENDKLGLNYYGEYNLHLFNIELSGLHLGIVKTYEELLKEHS